MDCVNERIDLYCMCGGSIGTFECVAVRCISDDAAPSPCWVNVNGSAASN